MTTNFSDIIAIEQEVNDVLFLTEQAIKDTETLSKIENTILSTDNELSNTALELTKVTIESINNRLGINNAKVSLENIYTKQLVLEDIKETIIKVWTAIKNAFNYILQKLLKLFSSGYEFLFGNEKLHNQRMQKIKESDCNLIFNPDIDGCFCVENLNSSIAKELHSDPIKYKGPDPSLLIGEKINAITVGTSIINYNKRLTSFLEDSNEVLKNARNIILKEDVEGHFEEAIMYLSENVPNLVSNHFGYTETELLGKFKIQSRFYYNKKIRVVTFMLDKLELIKIEFDEMPQPRVDKHIKISIKELETAESMRQDVAKSLDKYIKDYEHDLKEMIRLLSNTCDNIIKKNLNLI